MVAVCLVCALVCTMCAVWPSGLESVGASSNAEVTAVEEAQAASTSVKVSKNLTVRYVNVGQGDCVLISCNGQWALIDGGPEDASQRLYSILKTLKVKRLKYVIITHPDADHCTATAAALKWARKHKGDGKDYCSVATSDKDCWTPVAKQLAKLGKKVKVPTAGTTLKLGKATITFVGPLATTGDTNHDSLVCRLAYGKRSFLFTGDCTEEAETELLEAGVTLKADVLKVAHHGSKYSTTAEFLAAVKPKYAVICVGKYNDYGHPKAELLARLSAAGATIYRTDTMGHVVIKSNGKSLKVTTSYYLNC